MVVGAIGAKSQIERTAKSGGKVIKKISTTSDNKNTYVDPHSDIQQNPNKSYPTFTPSDAWKL